MMFIQFYEPDPLLSDIISTIMILHKKFDKSEPTTFLPFPPIPEHSLYFYPRDPITYKIDKNIEIKPPCFLVASRIKKIDLRLGYDNVMIRIGFKPGGLYRLLHIPMCELTEHSYNAEELFGTEIKEMNQKLHNATDNDEMKSIVELFLLQKLKTAKQLENIDVAMLELMKSGGKANVDYLAKRACLSFRQFERKCKQHIGIPPKLFGRIIRFSRAYRMYEANPQLTWTTIAHTSGYFDQMHFIRDFKEFTDVTPTVINKELAQGLIRPQFMLRF